MDVVSRQCITSCIHIVSQFLNVSSSLKAGYKENAFYDALGAILHVMYS